MGYFYFDESIHERGGFILGAWVFSDKDLTLLTSEAIKSVGLEPGRDEFKSGRRMDRDATQRRLRERLKGLLAGTRLGLVIIPACGRATLGNEALAGLVKIVNANGLDRVHHDVFLDQGVAFENKSAALRQAETRFPLHVYVEQDSRRVSGLQIADLAAHTMAVMFLETLGFVTKTVKAGSSSGYDPDLDVELGFELWASIRYQFFTQDRPDPFTKDLTEGFTLDTASYCLHIAPSCSPQLRKAATERFGTCFVGCIH